MQKKNKPMPTLLIRTLGLVLAAMLLCYVCTLIAFSTLGLNAYMDLQKSEMHERTAYIADVTAAFFENKISRSRYQYLLGRDKNIWGASVYVYNADGAEIVRTASESTADDISIISVYMEEVLSGKTVQNMRGIVIGVPVVSSLDNVIGAVFMVKPVHEIQDAMSSVKEALHISLLLSFLAMCIPVYFVASYGIARPIRTMTEAAEKMARGDYNTTVDISHSKGEIASLGHSLNELSHSLSKSMGSLKSERNMLREVLNGMEDGVIVFGLNSRMIQHNPAAIQLMDGHNSVPIDCNVMRTIIDNIVKMDMTSDEPLQFNTESGERILHVKISVLRSYDSEDMILVLLHDTTEATRYEQSRKDYVANVSHELRTPIANIKGVSEALLDGPIPEEKLQKY
ncbi:MAG: HAMP domain-containing protein, partial [Clostridia bacterium]|nr:HAMP domain-containing protein [Clostridia bacterium]